MIRNKEIVIKNNEAGDELIKIQNNDMIRPYRAKISIEGNLLFPKEFPLEYFEELYQTGKYNQKEILLAIIALLNKVCRVELWYEHLMDSSIFNNKLSSFTGAHDHLHRPKCLNLTGSIRYIGRNIDDYMVFQITEKGLNNLKIIFPEIHEYLINKRIKISHFF